MSGAALVGGVTGAATSSIEDRKKKRELDEARKAGLVEPEKDAEGNLINPHIPEFMSQAPWYVQQRGPGLQHQKKVSDAAAADGDTWDAKRDKYESYDPEEYMALVVRRYERQEQQRKTKRAEQRQARLAAQRKARNAIRQARLHRIMKRRQKRAGEAGLKVEEIEPSDTETDSEADGQEVGVDSDDEDIRPGDAGESVVPGAAGGGGSSSSSRRRRGNNAESGSSSSSGVGHSLRSREETAKYLHDLNPDSAFYEPGTRSMRENPNPQAKPGQAVYRGDAELLEGEHVAELASTQMAVWGAYESGHDITLHGNPTAAEMLRKQMVERKKTVEERRRAALQQRYGGQELASRPRALEAVGVLPMHKPARRPPVPAPQPAAAPARSAAALAAPAADAGVTADVSRAEALRRAIAASRAASATATSGHTMPLSRYDEDVLEGSHSAIFGSWYDAATRKWGFACCRSCARSRKCLGAAGIAARALSARLKAAAAAAAAPPSVATPAAESGPALPAAVAAARAARAAQAAQEEAAAEPSLTEQVALAVAAGEYVPRPMSERPAPHTASSLYGGGASSGAAAGGGGGYGEEGLAMAGDAPLRLDRVAAALQKQEEAEAAGEAGAGALRDERGRGFMSGAGGAEEEMTAEQVEAYQLTRQRAQDPMARACAAEEEEEEDADLDVSAALQAVQRAGPGGSARFSRRHS